MQIIQRGTGDMRDVVVAHGINPETMNSLRVAAPSATIGVGTVQQDTMLDALRELGRYDEEHVTYRVTHVGFGAGALVSDEWLKHAEAQRLPYDPHERSPLEPLRPNAIVSIEGWSPARCLEHRQKFVMDALLGKRVLVLAHALTSEKSFGPRAFAAQATGWTTNVGPVDAPHEQREGKLAVVGYDLDWREMRTYEPVIVGHCVALAMRMLGSNW